MDSHQLATSVVQILVPYLLKAGEELARTAGQAAWNKAAELQQAVKKRFEKEKDEKSAQTLEQFKEDPEENKESMENELERILGNDPEFSGTLENLLRQADRVGAGAVFGVQVSGGTVGEVINVDKIEGGFTIDKRSQK
jgi:uncharacterized protein YbjQ (UPF0145 family)